MFLKLSANIKLVFVISAVANALSVPRDDSTSGSIEVRAAAGLADAAVKAGKLYFGSASDTPTLSDTKYATMLSNTNDFKQTTPGNSMKWDATEPNRGQFNYQRADTFVQFAAKNGQLVRGHALLWHNQLPSWVVNGNFNSATLKSVIENHIQNVAGHFKGKLYAWDVVNEPFEENGSFRNSVFYKTLGEQFIDIALKAARNADPAAKLYINDYNIDGTGAKSTGMYELVKRLKARGTPIDGVGVQGHLIVGQIPSTIKQNFEQFASLGVEVAITELDIRMRLPATSALLSQQAKDYQSVIGACLAVKGCIGVTVWDWTDKYSWIPGVFSGEGAALPWDENFVKKPAYNGILAGFGA